MHTRLNGRSPSRLRALALALTLVPGLAMAQDASEPSYTISPNERIHVVQKKVELLAGRFEATLYPVTLQLNSRWTRHLGTAVAGSWHLSDTFAVQGVFNYNAFRAEETELQTELRQKAQLQPASAPSVLTQWYGTAGLELSPVYGKLAFYEGAMLHFSLVLSAGLGVADTRVQLVPRPSADTEYVYGPSFASAGMRPAGLVGAGFRVHLPGDWMVRAEVRDLFYSSQFSELNGCNAEDLQRLSGGSLDVGAACDVGAFNAEHIRSEASSALDRLDNSADTANQFGAYVGFSHLF